MDTRSFEPNLVGLEPFRFLLNTFFGVWIAAVSGR